MLIITKANGTRGGALCRVIRETPTRYYVAIDTSLGWDGRQERGRDVERLHAGCVQGWNGNMYVVKEDVMILNATLEQFDAYAVAWQAFQERRRAAKRAYEAEVKAAMAELDAAVEPLLKELKVC